MDKTEPRKETENNEIRTYFDRDWNIGLTSHNISFTTYVLDIRVDYSCVYNGAVTGELCHTCTHSLICYVLYTH